VSGVFYVQSTRYQDMRWYEVYFTPTSLPSGPASSQDMQRYFEVHVDRLPFLFTRDRVTFFIDDFVAIGPLYGFDLTGHHIVRGSQIVAVRMTRPGAAFLLPLVCYEFLCAQHLAGICDFPGSTLAVHWWECPLQAMDVIMGNFYELYFMRDRGAGLGSCLDCYTTTRCRSRSDQAGLYHRFELFGVDRDEPSRWFEYRAIRALGCCRMHGWTHLGDLRALL